MKTADTQAIPAPPNLIYAITSGFEAVANHIELILFPIVLDLLLWLGPHVRISSIIQRLLDQILTAPSGASADAVELIKASRGLWELISERLNLFASLRSYPVGLPSLMSSQLPIQVPLGQPTFWEISTPSSALGAWLLMSVTGLALGTLFYWAVSQAALYGKITWSLLPREWPWAVGQVILLALFWGLIMLFVSIPVSCMVTLLAMGGLAVGRVGLLIYGVLLFWLLFPLLLSPQGIFVNRVNMWKAVTDGTRIIRLSMMNSLLLFGIIFLLSEGLDVLWRVPEEDSWFTLVAIIGHAFVTSSLLAASFVFYRDADRWTQRLLQQLKFSVPGLNKNN